MLTIFVGGGKKAARKKPAWTRASQAASATSEVASGIVTSRETSQGVRQISHPTSMFSKQVRKSNPDLDVI